MIISEEYRSNSVIYKLGGWRSHYKETDLVARFKFGPDLPRGFGKGTIVRADVRKRLNPEYEREPGQERGVDNLHTYMRKKGFEKDGVFFHDPERYISVTFEPNRVRLRLTIHACSENPDEDLKGVLDLRALNKFILTGEMPERVSGEDLHQRIMSGIRSRELG